MVVIDVRTEDEWKTGHLDGAINIEWQDILKILLTYKKMKKFIYIVGAVIDPKKPIKY